MNREDTSKNAEENTAEQAEEAEELIPPAKEPESAKKKKIKRIIFYTAALTVTVIVSALLSLTVFFKIDEIYVEGTKRYPEKDIIAASMIEKNENLILCNTSPGEKNIIEKFPYVEDVYIQKQLFNKIAIKITEAKPFLMIKNGEKYFVLSQKGKIIEINEENKYDVPMIVGAKLKKTKLCAYSEYENENTKKYLEEVMSLVKKYEIKDVSTVDVTSMTNIFLVKKNGFKLIIGSPENLDYKFKSAVSIMNEHISETDTGVLDVSMVDAEGAKSYFKSKDTSKAESSKPVEESKQESSKEESKEESLIEVKADHSLEITEDIYFGFGEETEDFKKVQNRLKALGYFNEEATGYFGELSQKAFMIFEKTNGLEVNGEISYDDLILLFSANAKPNGYKEESSKQESSKQESSKQESSKQESSKQESSKQESSKQESSKQESSKQESSKQENSKQESITVKADNSLTITEDTMFGLGDNDEDFKKVQKRLKALGYFNDDETGYFGEVSLKAFKAFEKANGLDEDGFASPEDLALLFSDKAKAAQ